MKTKTTFDVTLRVNPDELAELMVDWSPYLHCMENITDKLEAKEQLKAFGRGEDPRKKRYTKRATPQNLAPANSKIFVVKAYTGKAMTLKIAYARAAVVCAKYKAGCPRATLVEAVKTAFKSAGYAESGASSAITQLVREGVLGAKV